MSDCISIDPLVTPYVDGELAPPERQRIEIHLRQCAPCHGRVAAERAVRDLLVDRKRALGLEGAPATLHATCASLSSAPNTAGQATAFAPAGHGPSGIGTTGRVMPGSRAATWRTRLAPLALAATVVLIVSGAFVYEATDRSSQVMAAELTADHVKCFAMNHLLGTQDEPAVVERSMLAGFGWHMRALAQIEQAGLRLVGSRPCLYGGGKVAHMMFRHDGRPVSVFMLPRVVRSEELIDVMGHEAAIWSAGGRTFVVIAREPKAEVERMASMVQAAFR